MSDLEHLPYRPCVGIALFNPQGLVFIGRRPLNDNTEKVSPEHAWQMPQGGIDDGESPQDAALRELYDGDQHPLDLAACRGAGLVHLRPAPGLSGQGLEGPLPRPEASGGSPSASTGTRARSTSPTPAAAVTRRSSTPGAGSVSSGCPSSSFPSSEGSTSRSCRPSPRLLPVWRAR